MDHNHNRQLIWLNWSKKGEIISRLLPGTNSVEGGLLTSHIGETMIEFDEDIEFPLRQSTNSGLERIASGCKVSVEEKWPINTMKDQWVY